MIVAFRLLTGRIPLHGLLTTCARSGPGQFSPARAQLLMMSIISAVDYAARVFASQPGEGLPTVSGPLLALLGGSQLVYLGTKAWSLFTGSRG